MLKISACAAVLLVSFAQASYAISCEEALTDFRATPTGAITYNQNFGGPRAQTYPLDMTLSNLGLTRETLKNLGPNVVTLGEGYSELFEALHGTPGIELRAVDPIYGLSPIPQGFMGDLLREFMAKYGETNALIAASSDEIPLPNDWADSTLSHMTLNNMVTDDEFNAVATGTVKEALRITKPGGKIILSFMGSSGVGTLLMQAYSKASGMNLRKLRASRRHFQLKIDYAGFGRAAVDKGSEVREVPMTTITIIKPKTLDKGQ